MKYVLNKCLVEDESSVFGFVWHTEKPTGEFKKYQSYIGKKEVIKSHGLNEDDEFKIVIYTKDEDVASKANVIMAYCCGENFNFFDDGFETVENSQHKG